jgi:uncharacterized membrane protein HdeD (DUF308 family)
MSASTPWKLAVTGGVGVIAGVALVSVDWTLASLAAFAGLALAARGALHLVTSTSFLGATGAFALLEVAGDVGVGITAVAWRDRTLLSLAVLVGSWAILHAIAGGTISATTRADHPWPLSIMFAIVAVVLGVILIARPNGSVRGVAVTIGLLALVEGTRELSEAAFRLRRERRFRHCAGLMLQKLGLPRCQRDVSATLRIGRQLGSQSLPPKRTTPHLNCTNGNSAKLRLSRWLVYGSEGWGFESLRARCPPRA